FGVSDEKLAKIFGIGPVGSFCLHIDLPLPAEAVEIVNKQSAHEGLQGLVNIGKLDPLLQNFVSIYMNKYLWYAWREGGRDSGDLGAFCGLLDEPFRLICQKSHIAAGAVLQHECHASGSADTRNRRRRKYKGTPLG